MFQIVDDTHASLRQKSVEVNPIDEETKKIVLEMVDYLKKSQDEEYASKHNIRAGVGLAAPQIGINKRMFAIYLNDGDKVHEYGLINPKILRTSVKKCYLAGGEGCLSVNKEHQGLIMRYNKVVMEAYDVVTDSMITLQAYGYLAIALQHEYDHLEGILFYDRINKKDPFKVEFGAIEI